MIDDLKRAPQGPIEEDLDNQILSNDPAEVVRQLNWQAQKNEQRISGS